MLLCWNSALMTEGFDHCPVPVPQRSLIIKSQVSKVNEPVHSIEFVWCLCAQRLIQELWDVYISMW